MRPAPPPDGGVNPPPRRPDVPCETQEKPNLSAPGANASPEGTLTPLPANFKASGTADRAKQRTALLKGKTLVRDWQRKLGERRAKVLKRLKERREVRLAISKYLGPVPGRARADGAGARRRRATSSPSRTSASRWSRRGRSA